MLNQAKVALACHDAKRAIEDAGEAAPFDEAAIAAMRAARGNWMAPSEEEAFVGAVGALVEAFPVLPVMDEARALGDRTKVLAALSGGVPVDMEAAVGGLSPFPDPPLDLVGLWDRSKAPA